MTENASPTSPGRRRFLGASATAFASASLGYLGWPQNAWASPAKKALNAGTDAAILPFKIHIPDASLIDLRSRIHATRWPERETVIDESQGVPLATMQQVVGYWGSGYDWRKIETRLNALPQFITGIDGVDIHFLHIRSRHDDALPLLVTHGWPGSIIEQLKIIDPLTNPTAHGASAADAFHLVIPHIPGYGFSGKPTSTGWGPERVASAWTTLMKRLGYSRFVAQGGDLGAVITQSMARQAPPELLGIHVNFPGTVPGDVFKSLQGGDSAPSSLSPEERHAYEQLSVLFKKRRAYAAEMGTRPQTLYGLADSPVALASWMLDHGDGYGQPAASIMSAVLGHIVNGQPAGDITRDDVLDDISLYWLSNTGISTARFYWESHFNYYAAVDIAIPAAVSAFPGENYQAPRSWAERAYHKLIYYNRPDKGGHFAAWEQPLLFAEEVRAGFRPLRR